MSAGNCQPEIYNLKERRIIMATQVGEVYICSVCGHKVEVLEAGAGDLVCCEEEMIRADG